MKIKKNTVPELGGTGNPFSPDVFILRIPTYIFWRALASCLSKNCVLVCGIEV